MTKDFNCESGGYGELGENETNDGQAEVW